MNDRELLELAAKAAGIAAQWDCSERGMMTLTPDGIDTMTWNPLTDDGDALRLAVKLNLQILPYIYFSERCQLPAIAKLRGPEGVMPVEITVGRFPEYKESFTEHDPYAATRRAIVRAAAEIGRTMK